MATAAVRLVELLSRPPVADDSRAENLSHDTARAVLKLRGNVAACSAGMVHTS